ncbi:MAG TPA: hypothetical protein VG053_05610 [Solirubrobacteraceae bacterium]|nr:hypothetical protein [Solirubrobacteraceae bacterium]
MLASIAAALILFALGAAVVLATGHRVPPAFWSVGGVAFGVLTGLLLPRPGPPMGTLNSEATPGDPNPSRSHGEGPRTAASSRAANEPNAVTGPVGDELAAPQRSTPLWLVVVLAAVAVFGLTLGVLFYAGQIHRVGCEPRRIAGIPGCETPLLDLADAFIFIASSAAGALLGVYVPRPTPPQAPAESPAPEPDATGNGEGTSTWTNGGESHETSARAKRSESQSILARPLRLGGGLLAALAGIMLFLLLVLLLALLPRATADGARAFHIGSLGLIVVTVALAAVAFARPAGKKQAWILSAVVTAVLAFMSNTASGLVVDRFTNHSANPRLVVMVKNYISQTVKPPSVKVNVDSECALYLVHLDDLVDDEPHIADHLPGRSFPLEQGARACGLKRASEVNAIAAGLAAR